MARWEPNPRERLERAALALFVEHGYDATTVPQIADRAGLSKSTFFRHYADKREVLFGGQEVLARRFGDAISAAAPTATIGACLAAALDSAAPGFTPERHELLLQRRAIIAAHSELRERELLKSAGLASAIAEALRERGVDDATARLAAELGILAFGTALAHWAAPENRLPYTEIAHTALRDLQTRAAAIAADTDLRA